MGERQTLGLSGWRLQGALTGVGRYVQNLVSHWTPELVADRFGGITVYTPAPLDRTRFSLPEGVNARSVGKQMSMVAWDNLYLGPVATESCVLYPSYSRPFVTRGASVVVTHDATMRLHPELYTRADRMLYDPLYGWSARWATLVITTTEAARIDIAREWSVDIEKIHVTHLASVEAFRPLHPNVDRNAERVRITGSNDPYFLFVGKLSGRRNVPTLLEAFAAFRKLTPHRHRLVIVGPSYATAAAETLADQYGVRAHVVTRSGVDDANLNMFYNCAEAFVMPSTYETVSFPIMESQAAGIPVVCVDTPGSREMTGGEALFISRLDAKELVDAMTRIADDGALRADLSSRGLRNAKRFSWDKCASETLDVCAKAVRMRNRNSS